ncbi:hypothetical protein GCM10023200_07880 [Actinomycetospora chlora]|uniref:Integral membrane protein n=1 Tax=Actinomycetospora chlora TaxID=663608 RepID=A0ABP9ACE3_9PSEU
MDGTGVYIATLVVGVVAIVVVGQLLRRAGHDFLEEVYGDRTIATSLNAMLVTLYHLLALGLLTMVATAELGFGGAQLVVARSGFFLLVLGGVYGLALFGLATARNRRRQQDVEDGFRRR